MMLTSQEAEQQNQNNLTQLQKLRKKNLVSIAFMGDKAYWVDKNVFYEADIVDGFVERDKGRQIDAHSLSPKELSELLEILDNLL